jgi:hypothetical protein
MTTTQNQENNTASDQKRQSDYEALVKQVEEKVWRLWLEELRRESERRNGYRS